MDKDRKSFVFYVEWRDVLMDYPAEVRYEVYDAIIEYAASGKLTELKPLAKMAFSFIKKDMDRNQAKYNGMVETNRENGKKGGAPLGNSNARKKQPETTQNNRNNRTVKQTTETTLNDNENDNENENGNNNPPQVPPCEDFAAAKSWRDDFEVYKSELKDAFDKIISDESFIEDRQKYHPNVDILLSLQKAYEDYWSTEAGWKKKKASKTKEIDWKSTFRKALDQPQNRVYKQKGISKPEPEQAMSELQEKFAKYLKEHAPMLLQMPLQPTDEEIKTLKGAMRIEVLLDLIKKINNDKYLTTRKNSVFQTIMELKQKEYGTT